MDDYRELIGKLVEEEARPASPVELDALLHWLVGRRNRAAASVEAGFKARNIPAGEARRRTLRYLDRTLFRRRDDYYRLLGLTPDCSFSAIRIRHKQLLQTFHPDRHAEDRDWFTERTEQLNRAYAYLKANHGKPRTASVPPGGGSRPTAAVRRPRADGMPQKGRWKSPLAAFKIRVRHKLKEYIGDPRRFERRLYFVLYSVPVLLLAFVYLNQMEFADHQSRASPPGARDSAGNAEDAGKGVKYRYPDPAPDPVGTEGGDSTALPSAGETSVTGREVPSLNHSSAAMPGVPDSQASPSSGILPKASAKTASRVSGDGPTDYTVSALRRPRAARWSSSDTAPAQTDMKDLIAVEALLNQYQIAYNISDIDRLSGLFDENAVTRDARGRPEIRKSYLTIFHDTSHRKLVIRDAQVERSNGDKFNVSMDYFVNWTFPDGQSRTENGRLVMHLVTVGDEVKIRSLE